MCYYQINMPQPIDKNHILQNLCYTELVYERINKKLNTNYSKNEIETLIRNLLKTTPDTDYTKQGKNYYVNNKEHQIRLCINSNTVRIITVDRI